MHIYSKDIIISLKKIWANRFTIFRKLPLILSLTRRAFFFFTFLVIAQLILFFSGNVQGFLDENLNMILFIACCESIGMSFFSLAAIIECIYFIVTTKKLYFYIHLIIFTVFFVAALFISVSTSSIVILTKGLTGI